MPARGREFKDGTSVVRSTLDLPRDLWTAARVEAARAGETLKDLLVAALRRELAARKRAR